MMLSVLSKDSGQEVGDPILSSLNETNLIPVVFINISIYSAAFWVIYIQDTLYPPPKVSLKLRFVEDKFSEIQTLVVYGFEFVNSICP